MIKAPRALPNNRLVNSQAYPIILAQYNELLQKQGKVNDKKFYEEVVKPAIPKYSMQAWYNFVKRFKTPQGLVATTVSEVAYSDKKDITEETKTIIMSNQEATAKLISSILNISAQRALQIIENPELLSPKEAIELGLKGMKAQDSRIHAVGKIREDNREQERFDKAFDTAAYGG